MNVAELTCENCSSPVPLEAVDTRREIANCRNCGRLIDVRQQLLRAQQGTSLEQGVPGVGAGTPRLGRAAVELPEGMSLQETTNLFGAKSQSTLTLRRRWLRTKHWVFLVVCAALSVGLVLWWQAEGPSVWTVLGVFFVLSWDYNVTSMFVNSTTIKATASGVDVSHGPLPSLFGRNKSLARDAIEQLFATNYGGLFAVKAKLKDKTELYLVAPLVSAEQALFVEQRLEKALGLVDFAVEGELDSPALSISGKPVKGGGSGAAIGLLVPVLIAGSLGLFFLAAQTEVSGNFKTSGSLGSSVFTPDDCVSGQREGFGGVALSSQQNPKLTLRVVSDPVKGTLVVVAPPGSKPRVFDAEGCSVFDVRVARTNTQINDVWVMQGRVKLVCPELSGQATFTGCH